MLTLPQMIDMIKQPGVNLIDNETLYRLLQIDAAYAELQLRAKRQREALVKCGHLVKLLRSYNPDLPMGAGMKAQFLELRTEAENG